MLIIQKTVVCVDFETTCATSNVCDVQGYALTKSMHTRKQNKFSTEYLQRMDSGVCVCLVAQCPASNV